MLRETVKLLGTLLLCFIVGVAAVAGLLICAGLLIADLVAVAVQRVATRGRHT